MRSPVQLIQYSVPLCFPFDLPISERANRAASTAEVLLRVEVCFDLCHLPLFVRGAVRSAPCARLRSSDQLSASRAIGIFAAKGHAAILRVSRPGLFGPCHIVTPNNYDYSCRRNSVKRKEHHPPQGVENKSKIGSVSRGIPGAGGELAIPPRR